jgi:hypothetical protein
MLQLFHVVYKCRGRFPVHDANLGVECHELIDLTFAGATLGQYELLLTGFVRPLQAA